MWTSLALLLVYIVHLKPPESCGNVFGHVMDSNRLCSRLALASKLRTRCLVPPSYRQCVEHLPRILYSHVSEGAQTDHSFRVRLHGLTVSKYALAWNDQSDHSASFLVNLDGLPSRRASTSIVLGVDPSRSDSRSPVRSTSQHNNLYHVTNTNQSIMNRDDDLFIDGLRLKAPANPQHDECSIHV